MDRRLARALAASLVLHAALFGVPRFHQHAAPPSAEKITARLAPKPVPPAVEPPAVRPEPRPLPPKVADAPRAQPAPVRPVPEAPPAPEAVAPASPALASPSPVPAAPVRAPAEPERIAAPAAPAVAPAASAAPTPPPASTATEASTIAQYRLQVIEAAGRYKRYPRIAQDNNWTGTAEVRLSVAPDGSVAALVVRRPSPHGVLDQEALAMIRTAHGRVPVPPPLKGRPFSIDVPVVFSLKDE